MITDEEIEQLNNLSTEELARVYIREVDPNETFQNLAELYDILLIWNGREFSTSRRYEQQRQVLRTELINNVLNNRARQQEQRRRQLERRRHPLIPPEPTQQAPQQHGLNYIPTIEQLKPLNEVDRLRS